MLNNYNKLVLSFFPYQLGSLSYLTVTNESILDLKNVN